MKEPAARGERDEPLLRDWAELGPLMDQVLDAAPEERAALIGELAAGDAARQRTLEQLVAECERDLPLLNRVAAVRFDALAREPAESILPELIADRYRTGRELGRGGMARVYLARDTKHGRDVAIKVIRQELSASLGHGRFLREIEIAARLRHPNIVPLYDSGDVGGSLYFVMPYEEGRSLRQRLQVEGALPIADAMSVLRDVARALAYAHEHGVVHRDVKPDNVMLSGDAAVVTDFGIAKAVSAALTDGGAGPTLTQAGSGIGTPAYMAPEQAMGDPATDHRADIYSFGCVAYELFTGKPPFPEPTSHQVIAAHLTQAPRPVAELRAEVPPPVADLIAHCLAKLPADRPQNVRDVLGALDGAAATGSGARVVPSAKTSGWTRTIQQGMVAGALTLLAVVGYRASRAPVLPVPITLAVLPLGNTSGDTAVNYLTDALPEEIASTLGRVPGIQIRSRSGARKYRGQLGVDVAEAGETLGADYVMTGVLRREPGGWILSADFSRAADKTTLWSGAFTISPDQQARAVETVIRSLLASLRGQFPNAIGADPLVASARNSLANEMYLRGQWLLSRRGLSVKPSADMFRSAIQEDTLFAPAYAGLSMALALYPYFQRGSWAKEVHGEVVSNAGRAIELDPTLALPHVALGVAYEHNMQWQRAEAEFQKALDLEPNHTEALIQYGRYLMVVGRLKEALDPFRAALRTDPFSAVALSLMSYTYHMLRIQDSARVNINRAVQTDPENLTTRTLGSRIRLHNSDLAGARALVPVMNSNTDTDYAVVLIATGDTAGALRALRATEGETPPSPNVETLRASIWMALKDSTRSLAALAKATEDGEIWFMRRPVGDPHYDFVRGTAGFASLLRRLGLPASLATMPPDALAR